LQLESEVHLQCAYSVVRWRPASTTLTLATGSNTLNSHQVDTQVRLFFFLVNDQRDAQFFSMHLFLFLTLYMFRAHRAHYQERQIVSIQPLVTVTLCRSEVNFRPAHDTGTDSKQSDSYTIFTPTQCTLLLLKAPDITICTLCLIFCPCMVQPAWIIFRGLNASAWLKLLLITIY
jgi:hypothetical protein